MKISDIISGKKLPLLLTVCVPIVLCAQAGEKVKKPFSFGGSYIGDAYYNAIGGLKTGGGFMGMGNIMVGFDTGAAGWWPGGAFYVNGATIHGKSLSENYLHDFQIASNIDAGTAVYMHELWFGQTFGPVAVTLGLQDLNAEFMVSENGGEFLNSSFGVPPVISTGVPLPIFPLTGLGVTLRWDIDEKWAVQAAVFDGKQTDFDRNPYNLRWSLGRRDGVLAMGEAQFGGRYKLGAYYHSTGGNYGFYGIVDQPVGDRVALFAQIAFSPESENVNNFSLGLGANCFIRDHHRLGLAATCAVLHATGHKHETTLEFYYRYTLNDNISVQPDLQYTINPSKDGVRSANALTGILRFNIGF